MPKAYLGLWVTRQLSSWLWAREQWAGDGQVRYLLQGRLLGGLASLLAPSLFVLFRLCRPLPPSASPAPRPPALQGDSCFRPWLPVGGLLVKRRASNLGVGGSIPNKNPQVAT